VTRPLRVAFTGGGTGGHVYPALAIHDAFLARFTSDTLPLDGASVDAHYEPRYFGNADGLERTIVGGKLPLTFVPSRSLSRKNKLAAVRTAFVNGVGVLVAFAALARFRPDAVVATGGYVCFPVVVAARIVRALRIARPLIALLEINVEPGLTNRLLAPLVDEVWTTFDVSNARFGAKAHRTGAPVRAAFLAPLPRGAARAQLGLRPESTVVLAIGGSQGARSINEAVTALVTRRTLPADWEVLHLCGERDYEYIAAEQRGAKNAVHLLPYLADPSAAYVAADVVVARSGASTTAELGVSGRPAVFVPYPHASDDHQTRNAEAVAAVGAAIVLPDSELSGDSLWWALRDVLVPDERRAAMAAAAAGLGAPDAARRIVDRIVARTAGKASLS
jgi:UDP-N-acetylglucosamine--N-acetylmuramyl-(pentapeptide) pyrophosphoryl-undecaprenol N-acetylglucosamine transferase